MTLFAMEQSGRDNAIIIIDPLVPETQPEIFSNITLKSW